MKVNGNFAETFCYAEKYNAINVIKRFLPDIDLRYFSQKPSVYDQEYITGEVRGTAVFKSEGYINKKAEVDEYISKIYTEDIIPFKKVSPSETSTPRGSWSTVLAGIRPMGQFTVNSLYSPELHAVLEQRKIGSKIFPDHLNPSRSIVIIYRTDRAEGAFCANCFIDLYHEKIHLMRTLGERGYEMKYLKSELVVAEEMGGLLYYLPEEIDDYLVKISKSIINLQHARQG